MIELISQHLETLISVFVAIGGTAIWTVKATKKKADADAMKAVQEVYQETIKDLREDKDFMNKELAHLRDRIAGIYKELGSLRKYKCTDMDCEKRQTE